MPPASAIPVKSVGWSAATIGIWVINTLLGGCVIALIRIWPSLKKIDKEADQSLRSDLMARIGALETQQGEMIRSHATEVAGLKAEMSDQRLKCDQEQAALQLQIKSLTDMLNMLASGRVTEFSELAQRAMNRVREVKDK